MLKVYVFKKHTCPDDKTELIKFEDGNSFGCPKCEKVFHKNVPAEWNSMGTKIEGSTRSFEEKAKRLAEDSNMEVDNVMVPEKSSCQSCSNYASRAAQATKNREKKLAMGVPDDIRMIPDSVSDADIYKYEIFRKTQTDYQETQKAIAYEKQKQERALAEAERQKAIAALQIKKAEDVLPKKEEIQPLLDPETLKIQAEMNAKDARIAELQKQKEAEKKLKEDLKKQDAKIAKLKKKLEESEKKDENKAKTRGAIKVLNGDYK